MAKALIFSDLHFHNHKDRVDRLQDCVKVLDWIFEQAAEHDCDYVLFLGDLFHERAKIDVLNYLRCFEVFMKWMIEDRRQREVFLLVGNHDMYHKERWDVNAVKPLSAIPGVHIIQSPLTCRLGGRDIDWLPHTENPVRELARLKQDNGGKAGDLLLGHVAVHGALTNTFYGIHSDVIMEYDNDMIPMDVNMFDDWPMTILGHYHGAQKLSNKVEYVGSPMQLSFGEAFQQKHVIVLDLATMEKTYVVNEFSPKHLIITPQDVEAENYNLTGNFVRVAVDDLGRKDLLDLQHRIANESRPLSITLKKDDRKSVAEDATVIDGVRNVLNNIKDQLEVWMREKGVPEGLDHDHLSATGLKCLEKKT